MTCVIFAEKPSPTKARQWRWHVLSKGRKIACSGEGYKEKAHARKMVQRLFAGPIVGLEMDVVVEEPKKKNHLTPLQVGANK